MKKLFILLIVGIAAIPLFASERVVWSGNQPISWNQEMYKGINQILIKNFNDLQQGEVIKLYVTPKVASENVQYNLKHITSGWAWTDIEGMTVGNGVIRFTPAGATIVSDIAERGLIITGQGFDLTKITIASANGEATIAKYDSLAISWSNTISGVQFYTNGYGVDFSAARQGYTVKAYYEPIGTPNIVTKYRIEDWSTPEYVAERDENVLMYTPETVNKAWLLRERGGLLYTGVRYSINRISMTNSQAYNMWEGSQELDWGQLCKMNDYIGDIAEGDTIVVTVDSRQAIGNWPQLRVATQSKSFVHFQLWKTNGVDNSEEDFPLDYAVVVADTLIDSLAKHNNLYLSGTAAVVSKVRLHKKNFVPTETTIWTAKGKAISWNQEYYVGEQFDTKPVWNEPAIVDLSATQAGDVLTFHVTAGINNPQYSVDYKLNDGWTWTELTDEISTTNAPTVAGAKGVITLTVSADKAEEIANNGLVFRGQGYNLDFITRTIPASNLRLNDNEDESAKLSRLQALGGAANVTINRTLYKDGCYNTLCLPFDVPTLAGTPLEGATVRAFESAEVVGDMVYVTINDAQSLSAGVPYLVRFEEGADLESMTFNDVTVTATGGSSVESTVMDFKGILQPTELAASESLLFLGEGNTLYWPEEAANLKGFRAYFQVKGGTGAPVRGMRASLHEGPLSVPTSVENISTDSTVEKRIENGKLIIVKDGVRYSVLGLRQ